MKLSNAAEYTIRQVSPATSEVSPRSEIVVAGVPTGKIVDGAMFQAALRWGDYILLFMTDNCPFEEGLNIYLLDANLDVVDLARIYHIYTPGIFSDLDLSRPDTVTFKFFEGTTWTLKLFSNRKILLPIVSSPLGVHRPFKFLHRFQVLKRPGNG